MRLSRQQVLRLKELAEHLQSCATAKQELYDKLWSLENQTAEDRNEVLLILSNGKP